MCSWLKHNLEPFLSDGPELLFRVNLAVLPHDRKDLGVNNVCVKKFSVVKFSKESHLRKGKDDVLPIQIVLLYLGNLLRHQILLKVNHI